MGLILPQFGIFAQGTHAHHFLEFDLRAGVTPEQAVASFRRLRTPDVSAGGVNLVVAFGADAWRDGGSRGGARVAERVPRGRRARRPTARRRPSTTRGCGSAGARSDVTWDHARAALPEPSRCRVARGRAAGVHLPRRPGHHGLRRRDGEPADPAGGRRGDRAGGRAGRGRQPRPRDALGARARRVRAAAGGGAGSG